MINQCCRVKNQVRIQVINNTTTEAPYLVNLASVLCQTLQKQLAFLSLFHLFIQFIFHSVLCPKYIGTTMMNKPDKSLLSWNLILQETCTISKKKHTQNKIVSEGTVL